MKIISIFLLLSEIVFAEMIFPHPGIDKNLFGEESPMDFFRKRKTINVQCVEKLAEAKELFLKSEKKLKNLVSKKASQNEIEKVEIEYERFKATYFELFSKCGDCTIREIEKKEIVNTLKSEVWYFVDSSCFINLENKESVYKSLYLSLLNSEKYSKESGGLSGIFKYMVINPLTGTVEKEINSSPFYSLFVIKGPFLMGQQTGFSFYARNEYKNSEKDFYLTFDRDRLPPTFSMPVVYDKSINGKINEVFLFELSSVHGFWFITREGYVRFFMAADLGMPFDFAIATGKMILFENLIEFIERGFKEPFNDREIFQTQNGKHLVP